VAERLIETSPERHDMKTTQRRTSGRDAWGAVVATLGQDVRYAARLLLRSPAYTLLVTLVLALGVAANGAVFSLFKSLALNPVPGVNRSGGLAVLLGRTGAGELTPLSLPDFQDLVAEQTTFAGVAGTTGQSVSLGIGIDSRSVQGELVTGDYFQVLGVGAQLGRTLQPTDAVTPGAHPVVVISDHLWRTAFDSDPSVIGRVIHVNAVQMTVVGVADPAFHGTIVSWVVDVFAPIMMQAELQGQDVLSARETPLLWGLGRLAGDVSTADAAQEMDRLSSRLASDYPEVQTDRRATVIPMWRSPYGAQTYFLPLVVVLAAMGVLLLVIVCANVSSLVLARSLGRRAEMAARLALGASRASVLRLLIVESLVLAVPGTALGVFATRAIMPLIDLGQFVARAGVPMVIQLDTSIDWMVVVYSVVLGLGSALVFSFVPARRSSRTNVAQLMRDAPSTRSGSRGRFGDILVISQVAVAVVLLVCAALVLRSLDAAQTADAGFDPEGVAIVGVDLRPSGYDEPSGQEFYRQLLEVTRGDPGIETATLASELPLQFVDGETTEMVVEGFTPRSDESMLVSTNVVAPDYFATLRIDLVAGRDFTDSDSRDADAVIIVNETMARRFWVTPERAVGQRVRVAADGDMPVTDSEPWRVVVGVVRDIKYARLTEGPRPYTYVPLQQEYESSMRLHVRARSPDLPVLERGRSIIQALDSNLPVGGRMLTDVTGLASIIFAIAARVLLTFGLMALALTALGTYGLVSYTARQRTREVGIRLATGADRADIVRRFLKRALVLGGIGVAAGLVLAGTLTRLLASVLYGVSATDVVSFATAAAAVVTIVLAASLVPAWRASGAEPLAALRER
jgi:predicted permease